MSYWVYVMASKPFGMPCVGMTSELVGRVYQHREGLVDGFAKQHDVKILGYYEEYATALAAHPTRENIKHWPRAWKVDLIRKMNPEWRDLFDDIAR